jgi:rRNA maturation RNase YbeY
MISFNFLTQAPEFIDLSQLRSLLTTAIKLEGKTLGDLTYVFCTDDYLHQINKQYLQHDTFTDIITFPLSELDEIISGEIYISLDRVQENAKKLHQAFQLELQRVVIHGALHLLGYDDHTDEQKAVMRAKEDYYLHLQP